MTRETEEKVASILDELSRLQNNEDLNKTQKGMVIAAESILQKLLTRMQNARHLNEWNGK